MRRLLPILTASVCFALAPAGPLAQGLGGSDGGPPVFLPDTLMCGEERSTAYSQGFFATFTGFSYESAELGCYIELGSRLPTLNTSQPAGHPCNDSLCNPGDTCSAFAGIQAAPPTATASLVDHDETTFTVNCWTTVTGRAYKLCTPCREGC